MADRLAERIRSSGPLPFDQWVEACLYDEAGAELVPASVQVDLTKGERCVLAHEGVTLRRAAQLAVEETS